MADSIRLDGHTWTDRGDGLYIPDNEYSVNIGAFWGVGKEFEGKDFLLRETETAGIYHVVAMVCNFDCMPSMWIMQDEINSNGSHAITYGGCNPDRMEVLGYAI